MPSCQYDKRLTQWADWEEEQAASTRQLERAARVGYADWLATLAPYDIYATLTYDRRRLEQGQPDRLTDRPAYNEHTCRRHVERWLSRAEQLLGRPVQAVAVVERHLDGWPHAHAVLAIGGLQGDEFRRIGPLWFKPHGFALLEPFEAPIRENVASYLAKYLVKSGPELVLFGFKHDGLQGILQAVALEGARGRTRMQARRSEHLTGGKPPLELQGRRLASTGVALSVAVGIHPTSGGLTGPVKGARRMAASLAAERPFG